MVKNTKHKLKDLLIQLENRSAQERLQLLSGEQDPMLWLLFLQGCREALVLLFRKHHKRIVVQVYHRQRVGGEIRLADVQDVFGDFVEQVLSGKFKDLEIEKDFGAFAITHVSFLLKDRMKKKSRRALLRENQRNLFNTEINPHQRVEEDFDLNRVIDLIPKIGNRVYRMVLYLVFIEGYDSRDLSGIFGKPTLAYDKRSRAMKAFRNLLEKHGILDELR